MPVIHPSALVHADAQLADDVEVGPYCIIDADVQIAAECRIGPYTQIDRGTRIGPGNFFHGHSHIGCTPQDLSYRNEPTELHIGAGNTFFQFITFARGTLKEEGITRMGDDNWIMAYVHIAHDCRIGNHTILASYSGLAGHVHIDDWVILGGVTSIHQFCHVGAHAMTGAASLITQDVPPYVMAVGNRATPNGINTVGLQRRGFSAEQVAEIKRAYKLLYRQGMPQEEAVAQIAERAHTQPVLQCFADFFARSTRGIIR